MGKNRLAKKEKRPERDAGLAGQMQLHHADHHIDFLLGSLPRFPRSLSSVLPPRVWLRLFFIRLPHPPLAFGRSLSLVSQSRSWHVDATGRDTLRPLVASDPRKNGIQQKICRLAIIYAAHFIDSSLDFEWFLRGASVPVSPSCSERDSGSD